MGVVNYGQIQISQATLFQMVVWQNVSQNDLHSWQRSIRFVSDSCCKIDDLVYPRPGSFRKCQYYFISFQTPVNMKNADFPFFQQKGVKFGYRPYQICVQSTQFDFWTYLEINEHESFANVSDIILLLFKGWLNYSSGEIQTMQICDDIEGFPFKSALFGLGNIMTTVCVKIFDIASKNIDCDCASFQQLTMAKRADCYQLLQSGLFSFRWCKYNMLVFAHCEFALHIRPMLAIVPIGIRSPPWKWTWF